MCAKQPVKRELFRLSAMCTGYCLGRSMADQGAKTSSFIHQSDTLLQCFTSTRKHEAVDSVFDEAAVASIVSRQNWAADSHRFQDCAAHALAFRRVRKAEAGGHPMQDHSAGVKAQVDAQVRLRAASFFNGAQRVVV